MKIVINKSYGSLQLSKDFYEYYNIPYKENNGVCYTEEPWTEDIRRDFRLIVYIEKFGSKSASGIFSRLEVVEIPKGTKYFIDVCAGCESIVREDDIKWEIAD